MLWQQSLLHVRSCPWCMGAEWYSPDAPLLVMLDAKGTKESFDAPRYFRVGLDTVCPLL